ncbi:MAG: hypothetical protein GEV09_02320 [Pseudonocardiaceae bacterium]|nr:hypothetical protein [Pseudonocardiaceae bacterium]
MSTGLLVTLTVVEIVALVVVLALFVMLITRRHRSVANTLGQVSGGSGVRAIQGDVCLIGAGTAILNRKLNAIAGVLPAIAEKAESLPSQQTQAQTPQQTQAPTSGSDWRPAVPQDPVTRRK